MVSKGEPRSLQDMIRGCLISIWYSISHQLWKWINMDHISAAITKKSISTRRGYTKNLVSFSTRSTSFLYSSELAVLPWTMVLIRVCYLEMEYCKTTQTTVSRDPNWSCCRTKGTPRTRSSLIKTQEVVKLFKMIVPLTPRRESKRSTTTWTDNTSRSIYKTTEIWCSLPRGRSRQWFRNSRKICRIWI